MIRRFLRWTAIAVSAYVACMLGYAAYRNSMGLGPDDYAIYSTCIQDYFFSQAEGQPPVEPFDLVINGDLGSRQVRSLNSPYFYWVATTMMWPFLRDLGDDTDRFAKWDFLAKHFIVRRLDKSLDLPAPYALTSQEELERLWETGRGEEFIAKYPRSLGYVEFSRIGYSFDGYEAVVEMDHICSLCGGGYTIILRRGTASGAWKVVEYRTRWVS